MQALKDSLPNNSFNPLIEMLEKLRDFAHLAVSIFIYQDNGILNCVFLSGCHDSKRQRSRSTGFADFQNVQINNFRIYQHHDTWYLYFIKA